MSFSRAFLAGMQAREARDRRKEEEEKKAALAEISAAKAEESVGYTADDGAALEAAAKSGQYDIGIKTKEDGTFDSYTVTPKADPSQTGTIAMQGVTDFLGNRTAGRMNQDQQDRARQMAMAGVLEKYDPQEGMRLRREIKAQERDDQRWDRQTKQWEREDRDLAREDEYRIGRDRILQETPAAQYSTAMAKYEQDQATYDAALKAGRSPEEIGPPPVRPDVQKPGPLQTLAGYARLIQHDYKYGKLNTDGLISFQDKYNRAEQENYVRALQVAQSGGTPEQVAKAFNAAGMQIDPRNLTISRTKQANGPDQVTMSYVDGNGRTASVNVLAELTAYGEAKQVYDLFFAGESNRRGNEQLQLAKNADGRAGARFAQDRADRKTEKEEKEAQRQASYNLWLEQNPNATEAQKAAARQQILKPRTGEGGEITSDYKPDSMGMGGTAIQKDKAGNLVVTKIGPDGKVGQPMVIRPPGSDSTPKFASTAEAEAAVKAGKIKPGDRVTIGGRTAVWMPDAAAPAPAPAPARSSPASQPVASPAPVAQTPPSAPPQAAAPRSVASVPGAGNTQDSALNAILASKAKAIESAASDLKTAQAQFAAVARSGDKAATAEYQRRVVAAQQRLNAVLGSMNEAQAAQVRRSLGI